MPFGEFLPFGERFPNLYSLSPYTGNFSRGELSGVLQSSLGVGNEENQDSKNPNYKTSYNIGVSVCYEDMLVGQARELARQIGVAPSLFINLTNDAWYGDTAAPHQHHLLAQWRSLETGRAMVRSTNTGLSAVVSPLGRTVAKLEPFTSQKLLIEVPLMTDVSFYVSYGKYLEGVLGFFGAIYLLCLLKRSSNKS